MKTISSKTIIELIFVVEIIVVSLLSVGCSVSGVYFGGGGYAYKQLTLNSDSTFVYEIFFDVGGSSFIDGKWGGGRKIFLS
ncbi:hypothetical protein LJC67_07525 [Bacteroidales bacterium OttesenSCG-928-A14]|nr:hypothetical protein [Bacteroidales bacterium OttesenSCG-928-A14]